MCTIKVDLLTGLNFKLAKFCQNILHRGRRWPGKTGGAIGFALNFLWLLSFFQEKESNNAG
jgi:hypothetical protein